MSGRVTLPGAAIFCVVAVAWLVFGTSTAWGAGDGVNPVTIQVGVATDVLLDVSPKDVRTVFDVWVRELAKEEGAVAEIRSLFLEDSAAMAAAIQRNEVDLVLLPTLDFLQLQRQETPIEPVRVGIAARTSLDAQLLLVHRGSLPQGLAGLSGKRLLVQPGAVGSLSRLWLDTVLAKQGLPESEHFFGQIRHGMRISQVVLPVFFRQAEAAVVKEASFLTVGEMNPQVSRDVVVLARSPALVHGIVGFNTQIAAGPRRLLTNGMQRMSTSAAGRQILTIFRINQLAPYESSQLVNVVEMVRYRAALHAGRRP
jgi:phosphonate transport system substrate-binding protein